MYVRAYVGKRIRHNGMKLDKLNVGECSCALCGSSLCEGREVRVNVTTKKMICGRCYDDIIHS